ncbi:Uncharacterised protein [Serratia plymuthica]|nr:Uncharacterised protein [Serratia plymuthica]
MRLAENVISGRATLRAWLEKVRTAFVMAQIRGLTYAEIAT